MGFKAFQDDSDEGNENLEVDDESKAGQVGGATPQVSSQQILDAIVKDSFDDRAFGCILGAFAADSCGSFNEFSVSIESEEFMDKCMQMTGGGPWNNGPGQVTDDSELAMCLLQGLTENVQQKDGDTVMSTQNIAKYYRDWIESNPFDIGMATNSALSSLVNNSHPKSAKSSACTYNQ